ncbi:MAG: CRISPR-associated protein Cas4 [Ktedonobacteraceae bacterium]
MGNTLFLPIGLILLLVAIALIILVVNERRVQRERVIRERHRALGLPEGKLVYEDADGRGEPLSSVDYPLLGKPDYVVETPDGRPVPVELKLTVEGVAAPYSNHVVQVAAYCLILEDYFEQVPTHGILRYADREFTIEYTPALRKKVIKLLTLMAQCSEQAPPPLKSQKAAKCRACAFQALCPIGRTK